MDDKTRGVDREDMTGRADETTRSLDTGAVSSTDAGTSRTTTSRARTRSTRRAGTTADEGLDRDADIRTRELQAEIADTREDMAETIEAIQDRLRPSNVVSNATERVKTAAAERARSVADTASETAHELMDSRVVQGVRQNPIPALMIGAGVAWLLIDQARSRSTHGAHERGWSPYTAPPSRAYEGTSAYRTNYVEASTGVDLTEPNYSDIDYRRTTGGMRSRTADVTSRASGMAEEARHAWSRTTRQAQNGFQRLLRDNPLLVGAAAALVGAAVGAALPETERENELMGEARDTVVDQAKDVARNAASTVQEVASDAATQVTDRLTEGH